MTYYKLKCQYCPEIVERSSKTCKATCFTCRTAKQKAAGAERAKRKHPTRWKHLAP